MSEQNQPADATEQNEEETELFFSERMQQTQHVARRLRRLADMFERGEVRLGQHDIAIPEHVMLKIELEEEHNGDIAPVNFEIEVEVVWPVRMQED
jgi:amphi-Trp domain-containing protein